MTGYVTVHERYRQTDDRRICNSKYPNVTCYVRVKIITQPPKQQSRRLLVWENKRRTATKVKLGEWGVKQSCHDRIMLSAMTRMVCRDVVVVLLIYCMMVAVMGKFKSLFDSDSD